MMRLKPEQLAEVVILREEDKCSAWEALVCP